MAMDAGTYTYTFPANSQALAASLAVVGNVTSPGDKAFFLATESVDITEVGAVIGTATDADTYAFTVATAPNIGGAFTVFATVTGPAATIIPAGARLLKSVNKRLNVGDVLRFTVSDAAGAGTAQFYAKVFPAGDSLSNSENRISTT